MISFGFVVSGSALDDDGNNRTCSNENCAERCQHTITSFDS